MADSNSQQPRCACGFWGSAQTLGLCSKCYKEQQKKTSSDGTSATSNGSCSASASLIPESLQEAIENEEIVVPESAPKPDAVSSTNGSENGKSQDHDGSTSEAAPTEPFSAKPQEPQTSKEQPTPGSKRERQDSESTEPDRPAQKNKKRCFKCNCKLELAIREIGRCRCDYVFCQLHRLPEQHDCIFNHKEKGRQEAREKMVSPKKHVGNSVKRIDSDS